MTRMTIGHFVYRSKREALAEIRRILHGSVLDEKLIERDASIIKCLYAMHPRRQGEPVAFCVGTNNYHGSLTRGFHAIMADGSIDRWSYLPCLSAVADQPSVTRAMRGAIMLSQREALRAAYASRGVISCKCGKGVLLADAQVHHLAPKFRDIANAFIGLIGAPEVQHSDDLGDEFADLKLKQRWVLFHDAVAQRVVVCAACNAKDERSDDDA